jgi:tRNA nucleotidyltransferase/poly(A) polymerase
MDKVKVPPLLKEIAAVFKSAGKDAYLVGGAVRDVLLGREPVDWDLATNATPQEVIALFKKVIPTGIKHGTVTVRYKGKSVEVTTFRTESDYSDGRRPDKVEYAATIEEDLSRRDFTMNAAAVRLPEGTVTDPFDGKSDIKKKTIRCVGRASERFSEDGLRPLRAVRFAAQLGFELEAETFAAIRGALPVTAKVASERVRDELDKILASPNPMRAFILMEETELLALLLPELASCRGVEQKGCHRYDVLGHLLLACDYAAKAGFSREVRLAALFHDMGKKTTAKKDEAGVWTFYRHERESGRMAYEIMQRFRYPNAVIDKTLRLISEHMFHYEENWTDAAVRRFIMRAGEALLPELFDLRLADAAGTAGGPPDPAALLPFRRRIEKVLAENGALSLGDLAVNGSDLIALGIKPGPRVGIILHELLETVVDDPALNTKEKLAEIAVNFNLKYGD